MKKIKAIQRLDIAFSKYIRNRDSIDGTNKCFTCGAVNRIENLDNGHYISRQFMALRFNEYNCNPQCKVCNQYLGGNLEVYRENLIDKYGIELVEKLESQKNVIKHYTNNEILELIEYYKSKI